MPTISFPMSGQSWTILFAIAVFLVITGRAARHYLAPAADSVPDTVSGGEWKTSLATAAVGMGWVLLFAVVALFCSGEGYVVGGLRF